MAQRQRVIREIVINAACVLNRARESLEVNVAQSDESTWTASVRAIDDASNESIRAVGADEEIALWELCSLVIDRANGVEPMVATPALNRAIGTLKESRLELVNDLRDASAKTRSRSTEPR